MRKERQGQDATYVKVALAALVGALVIMGGARLVARKPAPQKPATPPAATSKPATAGTAAAATPTKQPATQERKAAPAGSSSNDPFITAPGQGRGTQRRVPGPRGARSARPERNPEYGRPNVPVQGPPQTELQLIGIMRGGKTTAILIDAYEDRHYVSLGDRVENFTVTRISSDSVVLTSGGAETTLTMRREKHRGRDSRDRSRARPRPTRRSYGQRP